MLMELSNQEYNNPYKYNGKEFDAATGYYYYGARYYDPKRSFLLSVDLLAEITNSPYDEHREILVQYSFISTIGQTDNKS